MSAASDGGQPRLGVVILGASHFERYANLDNAAFLASAQAFRSTISNKTTSLFGDRLSVLDLFDCPGDPAAIFSGVRDFVRKEPDLTDVLVYYCGHGCFLRDRTYVMLLRDTDPEMAEFTGLQPRFMRSQLERHLAARRLFLVLDCCFAAAAAQEWMSHDAEPFVMEQFRAAFPARGAVLAVAASKQSVAIAPKGQPLTMFTSGILETLARGIEEADRFLSFRQVIEAVRHHILGRYGPQGVVPELHSPMQDRGDIADMPFFTNPA